MLYTLSAGECWDDIVQNATAAGYREEWLCCIGLVWLFWRLRSSFKHLVTMPAASSTFCLSISETLFSRRLNLSGCHLRRAALMRSFGVCAEECVGDSRKAEIESTVTDSGDAGVLSIGQGIVRKDNGSLLEVILVQRLSYLSHADETSVSSLTLLSYAFQLLYALRRSSAIRCLSISRTIRMRSFVRRISSWMALLRSASRSAFTRRASSCNIHARAWMSMKLAFSFLGDFAPAYELPSDAHPDSTTRVCTEKPCSRTYCRCASDCFSTQM